MSDVSIKPFQKILVANRGEIAIRIFRSCTELGIRTVAIYSEEDRLHLHRYKADEAYLVGRGKTPIQAYLDFDEIIELAVRIGVDAVHPGYGFLAENAAFAKACHEAGLVFIGPPIEVLQSMGDKVFARHVAQKAKVPVIPGSEDGITGEAEALAFAEQNGYPLIIKAAMGGGGRGMTIVRDKTQMLDAIKRSQAEAKAAFGDAKVFIEKYLDRPRHIEIQVLADKYGNTVHLFERDCSIQRRHQKVIEIAPSLNLPKPLLQKLYKDAVAICKQVGYVNAGTVEFLVDQSGNHYFIEVNPRIQVEHTITEIITGRDIVNAQIRIAEGYPLDSEQINIAGQEKVKKSGYAIQLRITTEDPAQNFAPDSGKISAFRAGEGFGIRLDAGSGFEGAVISPHYDSLLCKLCAWSLDFKGAVMKARRAVHEFRIRGVKTNIPFLENVLEHERFMKGELDTTFIESCPELFKFRRRLNRANKLLRYLGNIKVNGFPGIEKSAIPNLKTAPKIIVPECDHSAPPASPAYKVFSEQGPEALSKWILDHKQILLTDTTFRDAHQSLLATRVRGHDMFRIAPATAKLAPNFFSMEMWGGATFDVAMRFLRECPWKRLRTLRRLMPGTLLQMLIRSGNAVGYTNYPDNVVKAFIKLSAEWGIDVFRIFDCLNWVESMKPSIDAVLETGKIAEASICYSGDITDSKRVKFTLDYYLKKAKELEKSGCHILCIKDMAGLIKPEAARILVSGLKDSLTIPVHLHTHDTSGNGIASLLAATKAGADIVDAALSAMSGITSQPSMNALVAALEGTDRQPEVALANLEQLSNYWESVRYNYAPFECGLKASTADVYRHEIPGGQYSNYRPQAVAVGLGDRWDEVKTMYRTVNDMLGEVIKVTPSSKAVGDMALFMVQNNLTPAAVIEKGKDLAFPDSFVNLMRGMMGQPDGSWPEDLRRVVVKDETQIKGRPGEALPDFDFDKAAADLKQRFGREFKDYELSSYSLYPKVFSEFIESQNRFGDLSVLDTPTFFYGPGLDEEKWITIEQGKTLIVKLLAIGELQVDGTRELYWELNGRGRNIKIDDLGAGPDVKRREKADPGNPGHVAAPMSGKLSELMVEVGDVVKEGQKLLATEAMKMLNVVSSPKSGTVKRIPVQVGEEVGPGDLLLELEL